MNGPLCNGFMEACKVEVDTLIRKECWEVVQQTSDMNVVSSTWAFKVKRLLDGTVRKLKAHFCTRGYEQTERVTGNIVTLFGVRTSYFSTSDRQPGW